MQVQTSEAIVAECKERARKALASSRKIPYRDMIDKLNNLPGVAVAIIPLETNSRGSFSIGTLVDSEGQRRFGRAIADMYGTLKHSEYADSQLPRVVLSPYTLEANGVRERVLMHSLQVKARHKEFFDVLNQLI